MKQGEQGIGEYKDIPDKSMGQINRRYLLEPTRLYFLTLRLNESGDFTGEYSFDVESADDSHYVFTTEEEGLIRRDIDAGNDELLADALVHFLETHSGGELEAIVRSHCVEQYHFY